MQESRAIQELSKRRVLQDVAGLRASAGDVLQCRCEGVGAPRPPKHRMRPRGGGRRPGTDARMARRGEASRLPPCGAAVQGPAALWALRVVGAAQCGVPVAREASVPSTMSGRLEAWASLTTPLTSCHSGLKVLAGRGWMHQDGTWALVPPKNGRSQPKSAAPSRPHWRSGKRRADFGERPPVKRQKQREAQAALKTYSRTVKRKVPGTGAAAKAEPGGQRITRSMASQEPPRGGLPKS
mmetsp:Transcript_21377/g.53848  ORF Transcript_21377/g.53848 Transcript_21377/m.53848 type:complete len:239 (+) Transcript_21377:133-849(+)